MALVRCSLAETRGAGSGKNTAIPVRILMLKLGWVGIGTEQTDASSNVMCCY